jgi:hypothetical protein
MQDILWKNMKCTKIIEARYIPEQVVSEEDKEEAEAGADREQRAVRFVTRLVDLTPTGTCLQDHGLLSKDDLI